MDDDDCIPAQRLIILILIRMHRSCSRRAYVVRDTAKMTGGNIGERERERERERGWVGGGWVSQCTKLAPRSLEFSGVCERLLLK